MAKCCGQEKYKDGQMKNDRRQQLLDEIQSLLGDLSDRDRARNRPVKRGGGASAAVPAGVRDMDEECKQYRRRRTCTPPLITSLAIHEIRPTSDYSNKQYENTRQWTYVDTERQDMFDPMPKAPWELPRTPSQELRSGTLYQNCDCRRRNGLQHDCPRWDCGGRPTCLAVNPGPCCTPSKARKPIRGDRRYTPAVSAGRELQQQPCGQKQQTQQQQQQVNTGKMVCLCTPMPLDGGKQPASNQPCPKNKENMAQDVIGFVAMSAMGPVGFVAVAPQSSPSPGAQGFAGSPAGDYTCVCKPKGSPRSSSQGPPGGRYLCCPTS